MSASARKRNSGYGKHAAVTFAGYTATAHGSAVMKNNRKEGGRAELVLRKTLWRFGLRFKVHAADLPGRPDIVLRGRQVAIFCDGDFWHGRHWSSLRIELARRANGEYWAAKIAQNRRRDRAVTRALRTLGWDVIRVWETDILRAPDAVLREIVSTFGVDKSIRH